MGLYIMGWLEFSKEKHSDLLIVDKLLATHEVEKLPKRLSHFYLCLKQGIVAIVRGVSSIKSLMDQCFYVYGD